MATTTQHAGTLPLHAAASLFTHTAKPRKDAPSHHSPPGSPVTPSSTLPLGLLHHHHHHHSSDSSPVLLSIPQLGRVGFADDPNPRYRPSNEDAYVILPQLLPLSPTAPNTNSSNIAKLQSNEQNSSSPLLLSLPDRCDSPSNPIFSPVSSSSSLLSIDNPPLAPAHPPSAFLAVYDGHGGRAAADAAAASLHIRFRDALHPNITHHHHEEEQDADVDADVTDHQHHTSPSVTVAQAFRAAYAALDAELREARLFQTGTTAVTVYVHGDHVVDDDGKEEAERERAGQEQGLPAFPPLRRRRRRVLTTANVGDARAVLCRAGRPVRLSQDHRAGDEMERMRIEKSGGFVCARRVNGILEVSRALGDHSLKSVVVSEPYIRQITLSDADEFLILACDGLWDWVSDSMAVSIAQDAFDNGDDPHVVAKTLVQASLAAGCTDNVSVIVVQLFE